MRRKKSAVFKKKNRKTKKFITKKKRIKKIPKKSIKKRTKRSPKKSIANFIKRKIAKKRLKKSLTKTSKTTFANPMEIEYPASYYSFSASKLILRNKRLQHKLWGWCMALSIFMLLFVTVFELTSDFGYIPSLSGLEHTNFFYAEILSLTILGLELSTQFRKAKNKILFLKKNWFIILALLPIGLIFRAAKIFEGLKFLESLSGFRAFQIFGKAGELSSIVPILELPTEVMESVPVLNKLIRLSSRLSEPISEFFSTMLNIFNLKK